MSPRPVVAAAIVDSLENPTCLLAAERSYPPELAGQFELPGGKIDRGENAEHALFRELREELGIEVVLGDPLPAPSNDEGAFAGYDPQNFPAFTPWPILQGRVMWVWFAQLAAGDHAKLLGSHRSVRWVRPENALELPWLPTNYPIAQACIDAILAKTVRRGRI